MPNPRSASTSLWSASASVTKVLIDMAGAIEVNPRTPILLDSATTMVRRGRSMMVAPTSAVDIGRNYSWAASLKQHGAAELALHSFVAMAFLFGGDGISGPRFR